MQETNLGIKEKLSGIINPSTGNTLTSEKRWETIIEKNEQLIITYNRDGISPSEKRKIEDQIILELQEIKEESKILVKTSSTDSLDIVGKTAPKKNIEQKPAELKAGHGAIGDKKRVPNIGSVLAVSSCKGGVGKSTVSVNLALSLRNMGHKVGIIDADIYGPSIPMLLGARNAKPEASEKKKIKPIETKGIKFISFGLFVEEKEAVIWRGPMLGGVLNQFLFDTEWGELDYLIIDLPPGTGDIQLSMVQNTEVDAALIVTTPQAVALLDTRKGIEMFKKVNIPVRGIIENMSYFSPEDTDQKYYIFGEGGAEKLSKEVEIPFLGGIPLEIALRESSDKGRPYMDDSSLEGYSVWNSYMEIAKNVNGICKEKDKKEKGFFKKIFKK